MSYEIQLYRKEVKDLHAGSGSDSFFETDDNLIPFTPVQKQHLNDFLLNHGYFIENEEKEQLSFGFNDDPGTSALLTDNCLFFSSTGEGIFEINMTASELTDSGEFCKYDPQDGGWEEW